MNEGTSGTASIRIAAPPEEVYDLVSDVTRMGEWSPECRRCEWADGATGPAVGARFRAVNQTRVARWSNKPRIVTADVGREFAFVAGTLGQEYTRWTYKFEPADGGTQVTESFEMLKDRPWYFALPTVVLMGITDRKANLEAGMAETLRRLKAAIEGTL